MKNHFIIGLGGTGGKVIRNLRKAIYRDCRDISPEGSRIEYLYIDSSTEHMRMDDPEWKVLGQNLQLDPPEQLELKGTDLGTFLKDIHGYPAVAPWIGDPSDWNSILNLGKGAPRVLGGQKRRLGRLLFSRHAKEFKDRLVSKISALTAGAQAQVTIHIVSGLAGGTGAGTLIDLISIIRKSYPDSSSYPIIPYLLLPEENPQPNWNTGNYHANGYAALLELNALSVGAYKPYNLLGAGQRFDSVSDPFKICYLITDHNSNGMKFDVDREIPDLIAEAIYQKMLAQVQGGTIGQIERIEQWENLEVSHEGSMSGKIVKPERCRLFASFGIKKISYPEEEICDHIGYALSKQALLQMLYNNWAQGYLDKEPTLTVQGFLGDSSTQQECHVDRSSLFLERRFSSNLAEKDQLTWRPIDEDWNNFIEQVSSDTTESDDENWIASLRRACEERFAKAYRDKRGVVDYYKWKADRIGEYARDIADSIDKFLCADLIDGKRSLVEIKAILEGLVSLLNSRQAEWQEQNKVDVSLVAKERGLWTENMQRFADLGSFAKMMPGTKQKIFKAGKEAMIRCFTANTCVAAWEFVKPLVQAIANELNSRADHVQLSITAMKNAVRQCDKTVAAHTPEENTLLSEKVCLRLYNGDEVTRYRDALISSREFQDVQSRGARNDMREHLMKGRTSLKELPTSDDASSFLDTLEKSSHATLKSYDADAENAQVERGAYNRLFSVSIIDKLQERYGGDDEKMRKEMKDFLMKAGSLLQMDQSETQKQGPGTEYSSENLKITLVIMMPEADAEEGFAKTLRDVMAKSVPDGAHVSFVNAGHRRHEITILRFVQLFPLRYANVLKRLEEEYENRLREGDPHRRALEVHTEGNAALFPSLFIPSVEDQVSPWILLGLSTGAIRPKASDGTPSGGYAGPLVLVDDDDIPQLDIGEGYPGALQALSTRRELGLLQGQLASQFTRMKNDSNAVIGIKDKLRLLAKELSRGDDDRLKKFIGFADQAAKEAATLAGL